MKRRVARLRRHLGFLALLLPLALSAQACGQFSYFDLDLQTGAGFNIGTTGDVSKCHMFVSGATNDDFNLKDADCRTINTATGEISKIQYSTLADSGNLTFTLRLFKGGSETVDCQIGSQSVTLPIDPGKTSPLTVLKVPYNAPTNCP